MSFKDKVVVVTGAGKGLGKSIAITYAAVGARVIIADIDAGNGEQVCQHILDNQGLACFVKTDVSQPDNLVRLMDQAEHQFKKIDILINNAGLGKWQSPYELSVEDWDYVLNVNLRGAFLCAREAARRMREYKKGAIVNVASTRAMMSEPNSEAYAASKGGLLALTHALAASFAKDGIRVNCISPGWIETGTYDNLRSIDHEQHFSGRVGLPADIARACLYLTDDGNEFVNGTNLIVDGGMTRKMIYEA